MTNCNNVDDKWSNFYAFIYYLFDNIILNKRQKLKISKFRLSHKAQAYLIGKFGSIYSIPANLNL